MHLPPIENVNSLILHALYVYVYLKSFSWPTPDLKHYNAAAAAAKSLQSCLTLCNPIDGSPWGSRPWDSPGKNTGAGCHFLLQCIKVKSENEVAQSCPTLSGPMDCSPPGSSVHGIFQAGVLEWGAIEQLNDNKLDNWKKRINSWKISWRNKKFEQTNY